MKTTVDVFLRSNHNLDSQEIIIHKDYRQCLLENKPQLGFSRNYKNVNQNVYKNVSRKLYHNCDVYTILRHNGKKLMNISLYTQVCLDHSSRTPLYRRSFRPMTRCFWKVDKMLLMHFPKIQILCCSSHYSLICNE